MTRIFIVDDHDLVRAGVRALLERETSFSVVGETGDGAEAVREVERLRPDVVLMDINLPGGLGGLEAAEAIKQHVPNTHVIMLTQYSNREYVKRALRIGVDGYLPKSSAADQLREAVLAVIRGHRYLHPAAAEGLVDLLDRPDPLDGNDYERLSPRERQVFKLLAEGKTSREIGGYLRISTKTAMTHRANLMKKLNLHSRAQLIREAIRLGIIEV